MCKFALCYYPLAYLSLTYLHLKKTDKKYEQGKNNKTTLHHFIMRGGDDDISQLFSTMSLTMFFLCMEMIFDQKMKTSSSDIVIHLNLISLAW